MSGQIVLVRHAETQWSQTGQHTSTTDLPLLDEGRGKAEQLGRALVRDDVAAVMVSPLLRVRQTCELAGFGSDAHVRAELTEWNYGRYEGLMTEQVHRQAPDWNLWRDGAPNGESPAQVVVPGPGRGVPALCPAIGSSGPRERRGRHQPELARVARRSGRGSLHFGASAPVDVLYEQFGFTAERVAAAAQASLSKLGQTSGSTTGN